MEKYAYLVLVVVVAIIFAIQSYRTRRDNLIKLKKIIDKNYGNLPDRVYKDNELKRIAGYYRYLDSKNQDKDMENIDDITWNDLDMDRVFKSINNTYSSLGEDYLYNQLRHPRDIDNLEEFNKVTSVFAKNEEIAKKMQSIFYGIGRTGKESFAEYIHKLDQIEVKSNILHYLQIVMFVVSVAFFVINPPIGVFAVVGVLTYNIVTYYKQKGVIENYFTCFKFLIKIMNVATMIEKVMPEELDEYRENVHNTNAKLSTIKKGIFLISDGINGSITEVILDYARMILHIDLIKFNSMVKKTMDCMDEVDEMYRLLGRMESAIAVASYRKYLEDNYGVYATPVINNEIRGVEFDEIYHPLIKEPVKNSMHEKRSVLLTGSNASGKSTFLKTVAINIILSRTIYTATATTFAIKPYRVYSSMSLRDDLLNNESYYIVEIKALKRIIDATNDNRPMICFVDEVLRGTNTVERIAASSEILRSLSGDKVMCFAATHDIELTHILEDMFSNYHFEETVLDDDIRFNYILNEGRATTRNAIKLLGIIGYDNKIIDSAKKLADGFMEKGTW